MFLRNGLEPGHLLILGLVVILLFGSKKLPDTARALGKSLRIFKNETAAMRNDATAPSETPSETPSEAPDATTGVPTDAPMAVTAAAVADSPVGTVADAPVGAAPMPSAQRQAPPGTPTAPAAGEPGRTRTEGGSSRADDVR
ncbi:Sec-independent protein translocase subunit TatA [Microtetraspora sp. AC03309]|uniref:Sec-independent protein translocase subunit TatA n=1 Tax=Microtetraspora sp. AC03309 TaxID=2779376 RepID=UPI001E6074D6|nr:Sec-independent protein translocase subunit TatA [Microtetraspora sp. AC03309]